MADDHDHESPRRLPLPWYAFVVASFVTAMLASGFLLFTVPENWPLLLYPVVVASVPLWLRRRRWPRVLAAVMLAPMATFILSIGLFYVPAIALMAISAFATRRHETEAAVVADRYLHSLRDKPYDELTRDPSTPTTIELTGPSGAAYQAEVMAVLDDARHNRHLRVIVMVDHGGWSAYRPVSRDFIIAPDGEFVGE